MKNRSLWSGWLLVACSVWIASAAPAATPEVPEEISYQGVLLDDLGMPRTGFVDLEIRLFDSLAGGTLLYFETISTVPLTDGVFAVTIGPSGSATDPPGPAPLATSLSDALVGDLAATGVDRFLEVTVGSESPLSRTQVLTVPYALRSESAALADVATTALAGDATSVGGLDASFVTEVFAHTNLDGQGPGNAHPSEGLGDTDGDTIANFVDPDNDNDGLLDSTETSQGSDINLVTPTVDAFVPPTADGFINSTVTVQGTNFEPGLSVVFGSENPVPTNLTSTSFDVSVGPQPEGTVAVSVTRLNAEVGNSTFPFFFEQPVISTVAPSEGFASDVTTVTVTGSGFDPAMTVDFGTESPTPMNATDTSFQVDVGPQPEATVDVTVTHPNAKTTTAFGAFTFTIDAVGHNVDSDADTQLSLAARGSVTLVGGISEYDYDGTVRAYATANSGAAIPGQLAVEFDAASLMAGLRCIAQVSDCDVSFQRDLNGDEIPEVSTIIETGATKILSPSIAFDPSGRPAVGYLVQPGVGSEAVVAHDRDGDGQFTGTNERVVLDTLAGTATNLGKISVNPISGEVAYVYYDTSGNQLRVAWDRSGDGDYDDSPGGNPEFSTLVTLGPPDPVCLGSGFAPDGDLFVIYDDGSTGLTFARDLDADGDFLDAGEVVTVEATSGVGCDAAGRAGLPVTLATHVGGTTKLLVDRNDDGDFLDANENQSLLTLSNVSSVAVAVRDDGRAFVATGSTTGASRQVALDPTP